MAADASYEELIAETERAYDATAQRYHARWHARDPLVDDKQRFVAVAGRGASLVDLGCGTGRDLAWFLRAGHDVVGIDRSAVMLRLARAAAPAARLVRADVRRLPLGGLDEALAAAGWRIHDARTALDSAGRHSWLTRIVRRPG